MSIYINNLLIRFLYILSVYIQIINILTTYLLFLPYFSEQQLSSVFENVQGPRKFYIYNDICLIMLVGSPLDFPNPQKENGGYFRVYFCSFRQY